MKAMTARLWETYLGLQTRHAYGDGVSASEPSEDQAKVAAPWFLRTGSVRDHLLIVGPGRSREVSLLKSVAARISALTPHEPEIEELTVAGIEGHLGDIHAMPFETGVFDSLYCSNVMEHCLAPYCALMQCRRVVRDGADVYFIMPDFAGDHGGSGTFHLHCLDQRVWQELLHKTGFRLVDYQTTPYVDNVTLYHHFLCEAVEPPAVHAKVLDEIIQVHGEPT